MDPVSSSPVVGVEFGVLPRTPASNRSKNGNTPNGKENSQSGGSLHNRLFNTFKSRSRSFSRAATDGSPCTKPVRRRKSIVDLLNISSRDSHSEVHVQDEASSPSTESDTGKANYANLFSDMPKRRRSLGNILSPTNILGTITNKVSRKAAPVPQDAPVKTDRLIIGIAQILESGKLETRTEEQKLLVHDSKLKERDNNGPQLVELADVNPVNIDLFESRLARILDGIISYSPNSTRLMSSQPCNETSTLTLSRSPGPAAPLAGGLKIAPDEEKRPRTPDSYLELLIASSASNTQPEFSDSPFLLSRFTPEKYDHDLDSVLSATQPFANGGEAEPLGQETSLQSCLTYHEYQLREVTPILCVDGELSNQNRHDRRPTVTFRELSRSSTLIDLDPEFCQRQEERSERYADLGLSNDPSWKTNQEQISQDIVSTVARITRNYHCSIDDTTTFISARETSQHNDEDMSNHRCYGSSFEADERETWDSVMCGSHMLLENESCVKLESPIADNETLLMSLNEVSPLEFDDLSTVFRGSVIERDLLSRISVKDLFLPTVDEVLQDSELLRSHLEPFYSVRGGMNLDIPLELGEEIDFCPEYESFLRRSQGIFNPPPSILLPETQLGESSTKIQDLQMLPQGLDGDSCHASNSVVQVRYPGTVNLLRHTEIFPSMQDALLGLCNYKLGDLANFFVYDSSNRTIDAHLIDSPVPNPANLKKKGLQLAWIPQLSSIAGSETDVDIPIMSSCPMPSKRQPSNCDSVWEDFTFETVKISNESNSTKSNRRKPSPSIGLFSHTTSERAISARNSVFDDDFFLADQSDGDFPEEASIRDDSSALRALRAVASEEEVVSALDFDDGIEATKTWVDFAREAKANLSSKDKLTDNDADGIPWKRDAFALPLFEKSKRQQEIGPCLHENIFSNIVDDDFESDNNNGVDDLYNSLHTASNFDSDSDCLMGDMRSACSESPLSLVGSKTSEFPISYHSPDGTANAHFDNDDISSNHSYLSTEQILETRGTLRQTSATPELAIDNSSGYHFTAVKEYLMGDNEESDTSSNDIAEQTFEVLYDAADHVGNGIDSAYSLYDEDVESSLDGITETTAAVEDTFDDLVGTVVSNAGCASSRGALEEAHPNTLELFVPEFAPKFIITSGSNKDIEQAVNQENRITLAELNLRPVGKAARLSPPTKTGKSKVGALVNIFQDYGLMPERSRGSLQFSSVSPSFSNQTNRYRRDSSGTSMGSGTVRRISATFSTGSQSVASPISRTEMPHSTSDRPQSRMSDVDTEASFQFGEVLRRMTKHRESEAESSSARDAEMYG